MRTHHFIFLLGCLGLACIGYQAWLVHAWRINAPPPADWLFYHHPRSGLSFYYPPDVKFYIPESSSTPKASSGEVNQPHVTFFAHIVHKPEGSPELIDFYVFTNPAHLALDDFIVAYSGGLLAKPDPTRARSEVLWFAPRFVVQGQPAIRLSQNEATLPLVGLGKHLTFVASGDWVVAISLEPGMRGVMQGWEPTRTGQQIYDAIIATVKFQAADAKK